MRPGLRVRGWRQGNKSGSYVCIWTRDSQSAARLSRLFRIRARLRHSTLGTASASFWGRAGGVRASDHLLLGNFMIAKNDLIDHELLSCHRRSSKKISPGVSLFVLRSSHQLEHFLLGHFFFTFLNFSARDESVVSLVFIFWPGAMIPLLANALLDTKVQNNRTIARCRAVICVYLFIPLYCPDRLARERMIAAHLKSR